MKKKLHVIAHSHWDREWYMPFEAHRYRLIELIDDILEVMEKDDFRFFHLDGHVIPLLDYLEIKPQNKDKLIKLINDGRISVGPWYILQDAFLTSGESNIRNMTLGLNEAKRLGIKKILMTGYFPDTFGNISQAPQILKGFNINTAVFGRGLNEINFNNEIAGQTDPSEVNWESPDGSVVTAAMFSNWYCNAVDLPEDEASIKERFTSIIRNTERFSHINDLLGMNGCDHTPVQKNLPQIIKSAQKMFPNYEIIQSNFVDYLDAVYKERDKYGTVKGEIAGQLTKGFGLLVNTASTRIDIKMLNYKAQNALENNVEPLDALNYLINGSSQNDFIYYGWKKLIENHTHDSICTCSCDEVHDRIEENFNQVIQLTDTLVEQSVERLTNSIYSEVDGIIVFNKRPYPNSGTVKTTLYFDSNENVENISLYDNGQEIPITYTRKVNQFHYTLPKDGFRKAGYFTKFEVEFLAENINSFGYKIFEVKTHKGQLKPKNLEFDNGRIKIIFNDNGTYDYINYQQKCVKKNQHYFEYTADIGNEYNYEQSHDRLVITTLNSSPKLKVIENNANVSTMEISYDIEVPIGVLNKVVKTETTTIKIITKISLFSHKDQIEHQTTIINNAENLRIRAIFNSEIDSDVVYAHGQFDLVERRINPGKNWENPDNSQRIEKFLILKNDKEGLAISTRGLNEYEVFRNSKNEVAVTILRGVAELGDWGVFPTPKSQMKKTITVEYAKEYYKKDLERVISNAFNFNAGNLISGPISTNKHGISIDSIIDYDNPMIQFSALKTSHDNKGIILRLYNISIEEQTLDLFMHPSIKQIFLTNLNEEIIEKLDLENGKTRIIIKPKKIVTFKLAGDEK